MNNVELAKELILNDFSFLEEMGYIASVIIGEEKAFLESLDIKYYSNSKKREIIINYHSININEVTKYTFTASVTRFPYLSVKDFFALDNFLDSINKNFPTSQVNHFDREEADKQLKQIAAALKEYAGKIIEGVEWKENYYPRW